ncbi:histone deacetylase family protein [Zwartia vadi]|uniref:histone deacetylase family protein n=1 Tax=Zwartia vadi TaxID=3058168 RepID=UPI0025B5FC99|nr:histone deacetylase family protein [Zwartia vadi]MDN3986577.1 histone deacetylase family protein [Zwartia vadi]
MKSFYHPNVKLHHPQTYLSRGQMRKPQEIPDRVDGILEGLSKMNLSVVEPKDYGRTPLLAVHAPEYLNFLEHAHRRWKEIPQDWGDEVMSNVYVRHPNPLRGILAEAARYLADGSCPIGPHTWTSSYWAAQSAVAAAEEILAGERKAYALCRPPGHHARRDAAGGFCYINNAAVAAQHLRQKFGKVVVLDTDMHHGQGVQEIFYGRDDVMYVSVHGDPTNFYPVVAGFDDEQGEGQGEGFNLNLPMPHGSTEKVFFDKVQVAIETIQRFKPDAIVLALGFDVYKDDPQAQVAVTTEGFARLGKIVSDLNLPTVVVQEGGYHLGAMSDNTHSFFTGFLK